MSEKLVWMQRPRSPREVLPGSYNINYVGEPSSLLYFFQRFLSAASKLLTAEGSRGPRPLFVERSGVPGSRVESHWHPFGFNVFCTLSAIWIIFTPPSQWVSHSLICTSIMWLRWPDRLCLKEASAAFNVSLHHYAAQSTFPIYWKSKDTLNVHLKHTLLLAELKCALQVCTIEDHNALRL